MPKDTREPQSYGSGSDWVTGKTGQQVHDPKSAPEDLSMAARTIDEVTTGKRKVNGHEGGAKRGSYFKTRDYGGK